MWLPASMLGLRPDVEIASVCYSYINYLCLINRIVFGTLFIITCKLGTLKSTPHIVNEKKLIIALNVGCN